MRDTVVRMSADWDGVDATDYQCLWEAGDRSEPRAGCNVQHVFTSGLVDRNVTLHISYRGRKVFSESRDLRLERLPVKEVAADLLTLPPAPETGRGLRTAFLGLFRHPNADEVTRLLNALTATDPQLVVAFFNYRPDDVQAMELLSLLNQERSWVALPVYCGGLPAESVPRVRDRRLLLHGDGNSPPYRAAYLFSSVLFVVLESRNRSISLDQEKWMLEQLIDGKVAPQRLVVSCRPLEQHGSDGTGELIPQFRYYEKLLRGDVSLFVSSSDPVFYHGSYGRLETLSVGCAVGKSGTLLSAKTPQPNLFSIADLPADKKPAVYALSLSSPRQPIDAVGFPAEVGSYVRMR